MTRVLFLAPLPPPLTGQSRACRTLLDDLRVDHDVDVVDLMKGEHRQGFTFAQARRVPGFLRKASRLSRRADVVYMNLAQSVAGNAKDLTLLAALGKSRARTVVHVHGGGIARTVYARSRLLRALNRRMLRDVRAAVVEGESLRRLFQDVVPADRVAVVENFADDDLFRSEPEIRARFDAPGPLRVLFLGALFESKGWRVVVDAVGRVEGAVLDLAGACVEAGMKDAIGRLGPSVRYHGVVDGAQRRDLLAHAHVLCLPTWYPYEGQPLSILEAFASGCGVITTDHGGIRDVFADGVNGVLVAPRSVEALASALAGARDERHRWRAIGLANRVHADSYRRARHLERLRHVLFG